MIQLGLHKLCNHIQARSKYLRTAELAQALLRAFFNFAEAWGLLPGERATLLGVGQPLLHAVGVESLRAFGDVQGGTLARRDRR